MRRSLSSALVALLACIAPCSSAGAAQAAVKPTPTTSDQARRQASAAAERVRELTAEYTRSQEQAARAAGELQAAFFLGSSAETDRDTLQAQVTQDRARQAARIKALYVEDARSLTLEMLSADSLSDALWRASIGPRVGGALVRDASADLQRSQGRATLASERATAADEASSRIAVALGSLQDATAASTIALAQAKAELESLSQTARRLKSAEDAAAALERAQQAAAAAALVNTGPVSALGIPVEYESAYHSAAGTCSGLRWTLLAAVGQVESGHGRNNGPSSAGAVGPMQFMPATFAQYGVDANGDGTADAWDYADAIATAGRYLCVSGVDGTPAGDQKALFAYNRAQWYVDLVLRTEAAIIERTNAS